jgi:CRISPR-associated protein Cas6/Cse3/CasE subtype I-E
MIMAASPGQLREIAMVMPGGVQNAYEVHQMVYGMFCGPGDPRRFLFAIDRGDAAPVVLVRSRHIPLTLASAATGVDVPGDREHRLFRLDASPAMRVKGGKKCGLPPGDRRARTDWLVRQGKRHGFEIVGTPSVAWRSVRLTRQGEDIWRESAIFDGELRVTDPALLAEAMEHGLGRSHAFGFGLLRLFRCS